MLLEIVVAILVAILSIVTFGCLGNLCGRFELALASSFYIIMVTIAVALSRTSLLLLIALFGAIFLSFAAVALTMMEERAVRYVRPNPHEA